MQFKGDFSAIVDGGHAGAATNKHLVTKRKATDISR